MSRANVGSANVVLSELELDALEVALGFFFAKEPEEGWPFNGRPDMRSQCVRAREKLKKARATGIVSWRVPRGGAR